MAGGGSSTVSSSRRREVNVDVNLVPFIDLLSMCICFLLITAVWIQVGSLQVKQSHGTEAAAATKEQYDLDVKFSGTYQVDLTFKRGGRTVKSIPVKETGLDALAARLDGQLSQWLASVGGVGKDIVASAMITPRAGVPYGDLVSILDVLRKNRIVNLGVVPVKD